MACKLKKAWEELGGRETGGVFEVERRACSKTPGSVHSHIRDSKNTRVAGWLVGGGCFKVQGEPGKDCEVFYSMLSSVLVYLEKKEIA